MRKLKLILAIAVVFFGQITTQKAVAAPEEAGDILKGIVIDAETQEPLIGAAIMVSNTTEGVITDLDGSFIINLLRDNTPFEVSYIGYKTVPFSIVTAGGSMKLDVNPEYAGSISLTGNALTILMFPDGEMLQNAVVTGRKTLESLQALQNERITSGFAIENMGAKEMSLKGISNAQESVAKLSGISIASAGQLIVRGAEPGSKNAVLRTVNQTLRVFNPRTDRKRLRLHQHAAAIQHFKRIARAVPDRQNHPVGCQFINFSVCTADFQPLQNAVPYNQIIGPVTETILSAE